MFKTKDVSCLLQDLKFTGDGDDALAHARFYITPIRHSLALEISPKLADRLFRRRAAEHVPAAEIPTIGFDIDVGAQAITYAVHPEIKQGRGYIDQAAIGKFRAFKLFADNPDFTLSFKAQFQVKDRDMMWQLIHRIKKPLLLTFKKLQGDLEFPATAVLCEICGAPATHRTKPGKSLICAKHVGAYTGEEVEALDLDAEEEETSERVQATIQAGRKAKEPKPKAKARKKAAKK